MISTLQDLVAPLSEAEFLMLDWDELNHLIESAHYPIERLSCSATRFPL